MAKAEKPMFIRMPMCNKADWVESTCQAPWIIYDTETTGLKEHDRIVQLSAAKMERVDGKYKVTDSLNLYIKPPFPMPKEASDVNHITDEMLEDKPSEAEVFEKVREFFGNLEETVVSGYNSLKFDDRMMDAMWQRQSGEHFQPKRDMDFLMMARELVHKKDLPTGSHKLSDVGELYGIKEEGMHSSDTDVYVTGRLAFEMIADYRENFKAGILSQRGKAIPRVTSMWAFKKSKNVNYVYFTVQAVIDGITVTSRFHYDIWNMRIVEDGTEDGKFISGLIDMLTLSEEADRRAGGDVAKFK